MMPLRVVEVVRAPDVLVVDELEDDDVAADGGAVVVVETTTPPTGPGSPGC